jgi:hypothetical protein
MRSSEMPPPCAPSNMASPTGVVEGRWPASGDRGRWGEPAVSGRLRPQPQRTGIRDVQGVRVLSARNALWKAIVALAVSLSPHAPITGETLTISRQRENALDASAFHVDREGNLNSAGDFGNGCDQQMCWETLSVRRSMRPRNAHAGWLQIALLPKPSISQARPVSQALARIERCDP